MTNSTTSEGWFQKSNFIKVDEDPIQATMRLELAGLHATHAPMEPENEASGFVVPNNKVTNALTQNNRTNDELTQILCSHCPSQLPKHFKIVPLPNKIVSWLTLLLLRLPVKQQLVDTLLGVI